MLDRATRHPAGPARTIGALRLRGGIEHSKHIKGQCMKIIEERESPACVRRQQGQDTDRDELEANGGKLDEVEHVCHMGDVLGCEAGVERTAGVEVEAWL